MLIKHGNFVFFFSKLYFFKFSKRAQDAFGDFIVKNALKILIQYNCIFINALKMLLQFICDT